MLAIIPARDTSCLANIDSSACPALFAALDQQRVVRNLLRQCMLEDVFDIARRYLLIDEFPPVSATAHAPIRHPT
jgi:hypothetical protein